MENKRSALGAQNLPLNGSCACVRACTYVCLCVHVCLCARACVCVHVCARTHVCVHVCVEACLPARVGGRAGDILGCMSFLAEDSGCLLALVSQGKAQRSF